MADEAGGGLAAPGDLKMSITHLEMGGVESWVDPGIWGALLITKAQADEINRHWDATLAALSVTPPKDKTDSEKEEWHSAVKEFRRGLKEILTPDQIEVRGAITKMAYDLWRETAPADGSSRIPKDIRPQFEERLETILSQEQLKNYRSTSGMSPTGSSKWTQ